MEFLKHLHESEDSKKLKALHEQGILFTDYKNYGYRNFMHIPFGDVYLSIQASYGHYCTPRVTVPKEEYSAMEFAIISRTGDFLGAGDVTDNELLVKKLDKQYNGSVYGYVPVDLIEELYQELKNRKA